MKINNRMCKIGEYEFKSLNELKQKLLQEGKNVIDLSIGDPDLKVHENIIKAVAKSLNKEGYNKYPPYDGIVNLKEQIIKYYYETFSVKLNLDEVIILIGSKEGISKLIPAVCDIGDYVIVPEPSYPVYLNSAYLWGATPYTMPLKANNNYLPNLNNIPRSVVSKSKLLIINYPNNPTGAEANEDFYKKAIQMCYDNNIILCNDNAYGEIIKQGKKPISLLQFDKEKQCIEFGTMSKIYNMTGFRIGYAVGNSQVMRELAKVKSNMDSGQYLPVQYGGIEALKLGREYTNSVRKVYDERREVAKKELCKYGIEYFDSDATFYLWCKTPKKYTTYEWCKELIYKCNLIVTPGYTFGGLGYDYFRLALTAEDFIIKEGLENLKNMI